MHLKTCLAKALGVIHDEELFKDGHLALLAL